MNVYISGMAQLWNIPDKAPSMKSEVKDDTTYNPLERWKQALVLSGENCKKKTFPSKYGGYL